MKYRAKCTYCISQMANLYDWKKSYICHDQQDTYIEVDTIEEAELIELINAKMCSATKLYEMLEEIINS